MAVSDQCLLTPEEKEKLEDQPLTSGTILFILCLVVLQSYSFTTIYNLYLDDIQEVVKDLKTIARHYGQLAMELKLHDYTKEEIEDRHRGKHWNGLYDVLSEWLRWNYDHGKHGTPNRAWIVEAVESINSQLASKLKKKYLDLYGIN